MRRGIIAASASAAPAWSPELLALPTNVNAGWFKGSLSAITINTGRTGGDSTEGDPIGTFGSLRTGADSGYNPDLEQGSFKPVLVTTDPTYPKVVSFAPSANKYLLASVSLFNPHTTGATFASMVRFTGSSIGGTGFSVVPCADISPVQYGAKISGSGTITFGRGTGDLKTYDASGLDWTAWHCVIVRLIGDPTPGSNRTYMLYIDGVHVDTYVSTNDGLANFDRWLYYALQWDSSAYLFSSFAMQGDIGADNIANLNGWMGTV